MNHPNTVKKDAAHGTEPSPVRSVLFLGNSYTYFNDMPGMFGSACAAAGYTVKVESVTRGGCFLRQFEDSADPLYEKLRSLLETNRFDTAFLQEQSVLPASDPDAFLASARALCDKLRAHGARIYLYQTWGRREPSETLTKHGWTNQSMTEKLAKAYAGAAKALACGRSPVGAAFSEVGAHFPEIELYNPDHSHPSVSGSYLAALCHFAALFGVSPEGLSYTADLKKETARILQSAAAAAVLDANQNE